MSIWGTIPDWITAAATAGSLKFLIDYARSARLQVEASTRPVVVISGDLTRGFGFENLGPGPALNLHWIRAKDSSSFSAETLQVLGFRDVRTFGEASFFIHQKDELKVTYESISGGRYVTRGIWIKPGEYAAHYVENEIRRLH